MYNCRSIFFVKNNYYVLLENAIGADIRIDVLAFVGNILDLLGELVNQGLNVVDRILGLIHNMNL